MVISHSGYKEHSSYYACLSQKSASYVYSGQEPCAARQVPTNLLDEHVFNYLLDLYYNPDHIVDHIQAIPDHKEIQKHKAALEQIINLEKELLKQRETVLRWFRQKILSESEVESQFKDIERRLSDIVQMKKTYDSELAAISPIDSISDISATIKLNLDKDSFTIIEKKAAIRAILDRIIVKRVDDTRGRGSCPELNVQIKLK